MIERFNLTEIQSRAIVEMRLRQLTGLMQDQLHAEYEEIMKQIAYLESILADDEVCRKVMKDELLEVKAKYGDERVLKSFILPKSLIRRTSMLMIR